MVVIYYLVDKELLGSFLILIRTPWSEKDRVKNVDSIFLLRELLVLHLNQRV